MCSRIIHHEREMLREGFIVWKGWLVSWFRLTDLVLPTKPCVLPPFWQMRQVLLSTSCMYRILIAVRMRMKYRGCRNAWQVPSGPKPRRSSKGLIPEAVLYEAHHRTGSPAQTILDFAEERRSDLIVVGSRRLDALHAALLGSVSTQVLYEAKCPVTVVKENPHP